MAALVYTIRNVGPSKVHQIMIPKERNDRMSLCVDKHRAAGNIGGVVGGTLLRGWLLCSGPCATSFQPNIHTTDDPVLNVKASHHLRAASSSSLGNDLAIKSQEFLQAS